MPEGYTVDTAKLGAHQQDAQQAAATGNQVVDAGNQVTPGGWDNAYGLMFQMFPQATRPISEALISFTKDAVQALQKTGDAIGDAAKTYEAIDQQAAASLQDLQKELDDVPEVKLGGAMPPVGTRQPPPPPIGPGTGRPRVDGQGA